MIAYYIIFIFLFIFAINSKDYLSQRYLSNGIVYFGVFLVLFSGLRYEVGGDWWNYLRNFEDLLPYTSYNNLFFHDDPGFWFLAYFMYDIGLDIYGINIVVAIIFIYGLYRLLRQQPNPWLGLAVAFPYLIIVVSMGYVRQAAAIGFIMLGISYLRDKSFIKFIVSVFFATIFHKTAILMIGIGMFQDGRGKFFRLIALLLIGMGMWSAFLAQDQANLIKNYVDAQMQSTGAMIRVMMNALPALLLFYTRKTWKRLFNDYTFWKMIALGSIATLFLLSIASTAVDRMALYFIPIQVVVFSRLPLLLEGKILKKLTKLFIVSYYLVVMVIWLNLGTHAKFWLYHNILFYDLF